MLMHDRGTVVVTGYTEASFSWLFLRYKHVLSREGGERAEVHASSDLCGRIPSEKNVHTRDSSARSESGFSSVQGLCVSLC